MNLMVTSQSGLICEVQSKKLILSSGRIAPRRKAYAKLRFLILIEKLLSINPLLQN